MHPQKVTDDTKLGRAVDLLEVGRTCVGVDWIDGPSSIP